MNAAKYTPEATRRRLVESAAQEIHRHGFQASSLGKILCDTGVTKGALYHHFENKHALGLAVIDEVYREHMLREWSEALERTDDPLPAIVALLEAKREKSCPASVEFGCPINNLAQEMSSVDEEFRASIESVLKEWRGILSRALRRGQAAGKVRDEVDAERVAVFVTSTVEGAAGAAKNARDPQLLKDSLEILAAFVRQLGPAPGH